MSGKRIIEGAKEALAIAKGEQTAARIHVNGHAYVPEAEITALRAQLQQAGKDADIIRTALRDQRDVAERRVEELDEALRGLVGLVQLVRNRDDCPTEIRQALTDQYRLDDAFAALTTKEGE